MFTTIYLLLFILFFSLGIFIGKKFTTLFNPREASSHPPEKINIDLSSQYDTLIEMKSPLSFLGITPEKMDIIIIKDDPSLTPLEEHIEQILHENKIFLRVLVMRKD